MTLAFHPESRAAEVVEDGAFVVVEQVGLRVPHHGRGRDVQTGAEEHAVDGERRVADGDEGVSRLMPKPMPEKKGPGRPSRLDTAPERTTGTPRPGAIVVNSPPSIMSMWALDGSMTACTPLDHAGSAMNSATDSQRRTFGWYLV